MKPSDGSPGEADYRYSVEMELDTVEEQARALLVDLRDSFAPSYLTLISIIEGVLLGLTFQLLYEGRLLILRDPSFLVVINNIMIIALVWNEYRMGSSMFRWVPFLLDALIPFVVGGIQAALILSFRQPLPWLACLATFYLAAIVAFENMYRRAEEEQRNAFVIEHNHMFRRLNVVACLAVGFAFWLLVAVHVMRGTKPGWPSLILVTLVNVAFLLRGEANWRTIVAAARRSVSAPVRAS